MPSRTWVGVCLVVAVACGHKKSGGKPADANATIQCQTFGESCGGDSDCCSMLCDAMTHTCDANGATCSPMGASCSANTDCCSVSCLINVCQEACTADHGACTQSGQCCSGECGSNGTCTPLNTTCLTDGNPCTAGGSGNAACCSGLCNSGGICGPSSYCTQNGDSCAHDAECCGGLCQIGSGMALGTCTQPMPGSTYCTGVDGSLCSDCGSCCSRLCEVYAPTGVKICQPAEGCRVNGDLCYSDSDCCGAAGTGLPGAGNVICDKASSTDPVGICRNPMSCNPEGDVCHYKTYGTCDNSSARADCCGGLGAKSGVCQLDALGVPRCYGLGSSCQMTGSACADSTDCCNGSPCIPNGSGGYECGSGSCVMMGSGCTQTADCCNGATCVFQAGSNAGTCGSAGSCQQIGQVCSATMMCCSGDGTCIDTATGSACGATQTTGCSCQTTIF